jgi:hypothetical protein
MGWYGMYEERRDSLIWMWNEEINLVSVIR